MLLKQRNSMYQWLTKQGIRRGKEKKEAGGVEVYLAIA